MEWRGVEWKLVRGRRMREGLPRAPRLTTLRAPASLRLTAVDLGPLAPAGAADRPPREPTSESAGMSALRAHQAGGRRATLPPHLRDSHAAPRKVLSNDALSSPSGVDGVIGACTWKRPGITSRNPAPEARTTPRSGPGLNVSHTSGAQHATPARYPGHPRRAG